MKVPINSEISAPSYACMVTSKLLLSFLIHGWSFFYKTVFLLRECDLSVFITHGSLALSKF